jgi:ribonuclease BN (tRNA processing enzyme)
MSDRDTYSMTFLGVPPSDLDMERVFDGITVSCVHSSAGVSTSIVVRDGSESAILDVGDGALRDLVGKARVMVPHTFDDAAKAEMGRIVEGIRFIALSHDHFDHSGGLLSLLSFLAMVGRRAPLKVLAPEGSPLARSMVKLFQGSQGGASYPLEYIQLKGEGCMEIDGWSVGWMHAIHHDVTIDGRVGGPVPAVSYTVSRKGIKVFYTGDAAFDERMVRAASGCDIAIAEGTYPGGAGNKAHMSVSEASKVISGAKEGWTIHLTGASKAVLDGQKARK